MPSTARAGGTPEEGDADCRPAAGALPAGSESECMLDCDSLCAKPFSSFSAISASCSQMTSCLTICRAVFVRQ